MLPYTGTDTDLHLPAPGLRNCPPALKLLGVGIAFLLIATAVLAMVLARIWRDRSGWAYALPAGMVGAGLVGLIGYTGVRWGLAAAWCDVTIHLPPGRLIVERSRPKGYRLDIDAGDVAGVVVADQFHPSLGWELLLTLEDLRVIRVVNGRPREELEGIGRWIRSHLRRNGAPAEP